MANTTMVVLPEIKKDDELQGMIFLPQWIYKMKFFRFICYGYPLACIGFLYLILHATVVKNMTPLDILLVVLSLHVILILISIMVCSLSHLDHEQTIIELKEFRKQHFWDNNFFNESKKLEYDRRSNVHVYLHYVSWTITICVFTSMCTSPSYPQYLYNEHWSPLTQFVVKALMFSFGLFGYYAVGAHAGFYAYTILHSYNQMDTLKTYLRYEFRRYEKIDRDEKVYSYKYQSLVEGALLRCIKQHKRIVTYGTKLINTYNRWMFLHYLIGSTIFSIIFYCYIFNPMNCEVVLLGGILHLIIGGMYYQLIGDLFSDGYENFRNELINVKWYSLNKTNRRLYFMFVMFTQKKYEIELWPSLPINRALVCRFVQLIYSVFTLVTSVNDKK